MICPLHPCTILANMNKIEAGMAVSFLDIIKFIHHTPPKKSIKKKSEKFILVKGIIHQEDKIIINVYTFNISYEEKLLKTNGETNESTIIVEDLNLSMSFWSRKKSGARGVGKSSSPSMFTWRANQKWILYF